MDHLKQLIKLALDEDIGEGDITTDAVVDPKLTSFAKLIAKQDLIAAGLDIAQKVFQIVDKNIQWKTEVEDGDECTEEDILAIVTGKTKSLLRAERTALNFLQHLCGIATLTNIFVKSVADTKVKILDTRKTTPGMRGLEKHAVLMGDGENHRMGLFDRFLVKENHITAAGSITRAVELIDKKRKKDRLLEVETRNIDEVMEALRCKVNIIMLDNMSVAQVKEAVAKINGRVKTEVSGNITLENILEYAKTGVDYISIGAITHSAPSADISMLLETT